MKLSFHPCDSWVGISLRRMLLVESCCPRHPEAVLPAVTPIWAIRATLPNRVIRHCAFWRIQPLPCLGVTFRVLGSAIATAERNEMERLSRSKAGT